MNKKSIGIFICSLLISCYSLSGKSQENTSHPMDEHIIYYNVFNSSMIPADVAKIHNLIRAKDRVYVNIAAVKKTGGNGIAADVRGEYRNLMQQKLPLEFIEIKEATATYYLAPIRFNNEEILHIDIVVTIPESNDSASFTITKKLYTD